MIKVIVFGIPDEATETELQTKLGKLMEDIVEVIISIMKIYKLLIEERDIVVFFPPDRMKAGLGEEIIAFVECSRETEEQGVRNALALRICSEINQHYRKARVECIARAPDARLPQSGFHSIR